MNITYRSHPARYRAAHKWVRESFGKADHCAIDPAHQSKKFEWANISGRYLHERSDWKQMCNSCHKRFDYTDELREKNRLAKLGNQHHIRAVKQVRVSGQVVQAYISMTEAERRTGILKSSIANVLAGRSKTAGGFLWI